jgi:branched-chain amino acid transport system permease protein
MAKTLKDETRTLRAGVDTSLFARLLAPALRLPRWFVVLAIVLLAALVPLVTDDQGLLNLLFLILLNISLSQSWNILAGYAGQISLGHAAFFGLGAFVTRVLWTGGTPFPFAMLAGGLAPVAFALVIGIPTFRLRGVYFSIGTLAVAEALRITVGNLFPLVTALPVEAIASYQLSTRYYLALAVAVATMLAAYLLLRSRLSLGLLAIREDEEAAQATGVRPLRHKLAASGISSFFAGLAGATFAFYQVSYYPQLVFSPNWTFDALLITFVGGVGTLVGPVVGALFYIVVREELAVSLVNLHPIIFGILFILVVLALPGGLMDIWGRLKKWMARRS